MEFRRTVVREVSVDGVTLHGGVAVNMTLAPAQAGAGIAFRRDDLPGRPLIAAIWNNIVDSRLATVIGNGDATVAVTEHLLAALSGAGIDDCLIVLNAPEPPALDGDALSFLRLLDEAGVRQLDAPRQAIRVKQPIEVESGGASAKLLPSGEPQFFFEIDFPTPAIGRQSFQLAFSESAFRSEIAPARTFGFLKDAEQLHKSGYGRGASFDNTLVIDGDRVCNPEKRRFPDEFARHKILDAVGDMKLAGARLLARFVGRRSSHSLNAALLRALFADRENFELIPA